MQAATNALGLVLADPVTWKPFAQVALRDVFTKDHEQLLRLRRRLIEREPRHVKMVVHAAEAGLRHDSRNFKGPEKFIAVLSQLGIIANVAIREAICEGMILAIDDVVEVRPAR